MRAAWISRLPAFLLALACILSSTAVLAAPGGATTGGGAVTPARVPAAGERDPLPGDTIENAFLIRDLPYEDHYHTIGYNADYSVSCPYIFGPQPDVVYRYDATERISVDISLCNPGTDYDSKIFVYENYVGFDVGCNDDACSGPDFPGPYLSRLESVSFFPGNTYYIVVTGYFGCSGNYTLTVNQRDILHEVRADGTGEYPTIQAAIDAAYPGDVVELADGVYTGPGNVNLYFPGLEFTFRSQSRDPESCIIDGEETSRGMRFTSEEPASTLVEGVTIRNCRAEGASGAAVYLEHAVTRFRDCIFESNVADEDGGAVAGHSGLPHFESCLFRQNWAHNRGGGLYLYYTNEGEVASGCTFTGNKAAAAGGGVFLYGADVTFNGCTITDNLVPGAEGFGGGIAATATSHLGLQTTIIAFNHAGSCGGLSASDCFADCCDFFGNTYDNWCGSSPPPGWQNIVVADPLFCDFDGEDYALHADSPCAPFTPPNPSCPLIGAWPVGCEATGVAGAGSRGSGGFHALPNPMRVGCVFLLDGRWSAGTSVEIFDPSGRCLRTLVLSDAPAHEGRLPWDGRDEKGRPIPSGLYFARLVEPGKILPGAGPLRVLVLR